MEDLKYFNTENDYKLFNVKYPNVSYTEDNDMVWIKEYENSLITTYNVTSTSSNVKLLGDKFNISQVDEMYVDGELIESPINNYKFDTLGLHEVKIKFNNLHDCSNMFNYCKPLINLNFELFDTSNVTDMSYMFDYCDNLASLDFTSFNTSKVTDMNHMFHWCQNLSSLDLSGWDTSNVTDMGYMFDYCENLIDLDLSGWNTSNVTNMESMFEYLPVTSMTQVKGFENFNTSNVTDMNTMFSALFNLKELDLSHLDTSKVINFDELVCDCYALQKINFGGKFSTVSAKYMNDIFQECYSLTELDLSNWDTSNVEEMWMLFCYCSNLTSITFGDKWDTSNVTDMYDMFYECSKLTSLDLSNWNTSNVTDMSSMFGYCCNLTSLDLSGWDTSNVTDMSYMFDNCNIKDLTISDSFNISKVSNTKNMFSNTPNFIFNYNCNIDYSKILNYQNTSFIGYSNCLTKEQVCLVKLYDNANNWELITDSTLNLTLSNGTVGVYDETQNGFVFTFNNIKNVPTYDILLNGEVIGVLRCDDTNINVTLNMGHNYIYEVVSVSSITNNVLLINENYLPYISEMYIDGIKQENVVSSYKLPTLKKYEILYVFDDTKTITSCNGMFKDCNNIDLLNLSNFDTSDVTDMGYMFYNCKNLASLDLSGWDTSNVTDMSYMFYNCNVLYSLDLSNFDTSDVIDMSYMFYNCYSLTSLDVSRFNTSNVTDMSYMFYKCSYLPSLDLSNFDTSNVIDMGYMFYNCNNLASLDLSNWNTSKVTDMSYMFDYCYILTSLDLSGWDTSNVTDMNSMFDSCYALTSLDVSNFDTSNVTSMYGMFKSCHSLTSLDLSNFDTSNITDMSYMFAYNPHFTSLDLSNFDTSKVTNMNFMFSDNNNLKEITLFFYIIDDNYTSRMFDDCLNLKTIKTCNEYVDAYKNIIEYDLPYCNYEIIYTPTECTNLTIEGKNVGCYATSTKISYTATTNGLDYDGNAINGIKIYGSDESELFDENHDTNNAIERIITYNYLGVESSTTILQDKVYNEEYSIDLMNEWRLSTTISNPDSTLYDGVYESFSNKGIHESIAKCKITLKGYKKFTIYATSNGDYGDGIKVGMLDVENINQSTTPNLIKYYNSKPLDGNIFSNYQKIEYDNIDGGIHSISVIYSKDYRSNKGTDQGYLIIEK